MELLYFFGILLSLAALVAFFSMSSDLSKIRKMLAFFRDLELKNPENWINIICQGCGKGFRISKVVNNSVRCPHCNSKNNPPE